MKKHTNTKVSLLIGLLSFYNLSSCINSRLPLGVRPYNGISDVECGDNATKITIEKLTTPLPHNVTILIKRSNLALLSGLILIHLIITPLATLLGPCNPNIHCPRMPTGWNKTSHANRSLTEETLYNTTATQETFIINATTKDPGNLVFNGKHSNWVADAD